MGVDRRDGVNAKPPASIVLGFSVTVATVINHIKSSFVSVLIRLIVVTALWKTVGDDKILLTLILRYSKGSKSELSALNGSDLILKVHHIT